MSCLPAIPEGEVILEYDAHVLTDEPAIVMRRADTGKTLGAMWGVTWEQFDQVAGVDG